MSYSTTAPTNRATHQHHANRGKMYTPRGAQSRGFYTPAQRQGSGTPRYQPYPRHASHPTDNGGQKWLTVADGLVQTGPRNYKMALSDCKTVSLNEYQGYTYAHIWDNVKKAHVSLNYDELKQLVAHDQELIASMEVLQIGDQLELDLPSSQE